MRLLRASIGVASLVLGVLPTISASIAFADGTATFVPIGNPTTSRRAGHTATLLSDGKVLIVGGYYSPTTAELYDPVAGSSAPIGAPTTTPAGHTATLLPNGKVLIVGGAYSPTTAELYDPVSGTFAPIGNPTTSRRAGHTATLLSDGKVLIVGGYYSPTTAELYDPVAGTSAPIGPPTTTPAGHTATLLPDGKVLIVGGHYSPTTAELYDPVSGTFAPIGTRTTSRRGGHTATLLPDGKVLIVGGHYSPTTAELYDPVSGTSAPIGPPTTTRAGHTATLLPDGKVLIVGGDYSPTTAELYAPPADSTPPNVSASRSPEANANGWNNTDVTVTAAGIDSGSGIASCTTVVVSAEGAGQSATVSCTDKAGNTASATVNDINIDKTPPAVTVPAALTQEATGTSGTVVTFTATATDLLDPSPAVTCLPASGSTFPLGVTTVTCTATDAAGNSGSSSFTVTVRDTIPPVLDLPASITAAATGPSGAVVTFTVTATDTVTPSPTVLCTPASGSTFAIGTTTVSCTATDAAGNTTTGAFSVHVTSASEQAKALADTVADIGSGTSLSAKVQNLEARIAAGNTTAACNSINALLNEVSAQTGKELTLAQAAAITAHASRIAAVLGC